MSTFLILKICISSFNTILHFPKEEFFTALCKLFVPGSYKLSNNVCSQIDFWLTYCSADICTHTKLKAFVLPACRLRVHSLSFVS